MLNHGEARNSVALSLAATTAYFFVAWFAIAGVLFIVAFFAVALVNPQYPRIDQLTTIAGPAAIVVSCPVAWLAARCVYRLLRWYPSEPGQNCPTCNYNLTGNKSGRCPECGQPCPPPA